MKYKVGDEVVVRSKRFPSQNNDRGKIVATKNDRECYDYQYLVQIEFGREKGRELLYDDTDLRLYTKLDKALS